MPQILKCIRNAFRVIESISYSVENEYDYRGLGWSLAVTGSGNSGLQPHVHLQTSEEHKSHAVKGFQRPCFTLKVMYCLLCSHAMETTKIIHNNKNIFHPSCTKSFVFPVPFNCSSLLKSSLEDGSQTHPDAQLSSVPGSSRV